MVKSNPFVGGQHLSVSRFYLPKGNLLFTLNAITPFISYALCKNSCILGILKRVCRLLNKQPPTYSAPWQNSKTSKRLKYQNMSNKSMTKCLYFGRIHLVHLRICKYLTGDSSINFHGKFFLHFLLNFRF